MAFCLTDGSYGLQDLDDNSKYISTGEHYNPRTGVTNTMDLKDNHKPVFKDCANYRPTVKEEQPRGTFVINVTATDNDPPDSGGTITYKVINRDGDRKYFNINSTTGEITTNDVFDRDEPSRQKELYVTVQATDNGRPVLADVCTFKVTIEDINDNDPVFDQTSYEEQVSEDLKENGEVMRVFAYDYDDGENSRLTYTISPRSLGYSSLVDEYFRIDNKTGVIYLNKALNKVRATFCVVTLKYPKHFRKPAQYSKCK